MLKKNNLSICRTGLLCAFLIFFFSQVSKAAIGVGDIAVIGYNSDGATSTKDFTVVTLATINSGETIYITDKGWTATSGGSFMADITTEGIFSWFTTSTIPRGTVINFAVTSGASPSVLATPAVGTLAVINGWTNTASTSPFGTNGDQVVIYQGSAISPTFIFAFNAGSNAADFSSGWQTNATSGNAASNLPTGLTNGANAVSFASAALDNYVYTGSFAGTKVAVLAAICNTSNWTGDDANPYNLVPSIPSSKFPGTNPIFAVNTSPTVSSVSYAGTINVGQTLTGNYTYTDTDNDVESGSAFAWYRSDNLSGLNKQATGATSKTYILTAADLNKYMSFQVTPRDGIAFGTAVESSLLGPVLANSLPVTLVYFKVKAEGSIAKLEWSTASEKDNNMFEIYRAADGKSFTKLGIVKGNGTTSTRTDYRYEDRSPLNGINYYRLIQVDMDGKFIELGTEAFNFSLNQEQVSLHPNPAKEWVTISFPTGTKSLALVDANGKVLKKQILKSTDTSVTIQMGQFPVGAYFVRLETTKGGITQKFVKY